MKLRKKKKDDEQIALAMLRGKLFNANQVHPERFANTEEWRKANKHAQR